MSEKAKTWAEWKKKFQKEIVADLKKWFDEPRRLGDRYCVTYDPCGGCAGYNEWCDLHLDECNGKYWKPRRPE